MYSNALNKGTVQGCKIKQNTAKENKSKESKSAEIEAEKRVTKMRTLKTVYYTIINRTSLIIQNNF